MEEIIRHWPIANGPLEISSIEEGLINASYLIRISKETYILQKVNQQVFQQPEILEKNYHVIRDHLLNQNYPFEVLEWFSTKEGKLTNQIDGSYYRLGRFFKGTKTIHSVSDPDLAFKVGKAFGTLDLALSGIAVEEIEDSIPSFHHLSKYLNHLKTSMLSASSQRQASSKNLMNFIDEFSYLESPNFSKNRIIHNDAKISNILFKHDAIHSIIDWDTMMAGHISWEFADLVRSSTVSVPEDHPNIKELDVQLELFQGLTTGFKSAIFDHISSAEKESLYRGVLYLVFEQAIRFLADYLADDQYYKCDYDDHNLVRATNQFELLRILDARKAEIQKIIRQA